MFGRPIGQNQGVQFPIAERLHRGRGRRPDALRGVRAVRRAQAVRRRGQHGEVPRRQGIVGGGQRLPAVPRRLRLRGRIRRRAQVPRDAAVPGRADLDQPDPAATWRSTCSACRGVSEILDAAAFKASLVVTSRARDRGAVLHAPACRSRRARDQGRAAGHAATSRAATTSACSGLASHFRLDQPQQGKPDARRQASAKRRRSSARCVARRRAGAEPRAGRRGAARPVVRGAARRASAPDRLRHLRLRRPTARTATRRPTTC